jgi:hypothetical protein
MTPAKAKKMLLGAANAKLQIYANGGNTMKHEVGKDIVAATTFILGAVKKVGTEVTDIAKTGLKGADLDDAVVKKLDEVAQESLDLISGSVDEVAGKSINKFLKENDVKGNFLNYEGPTINSAKLQKGDKLNSTEVQNILNEEKAFVEPGNLDEIANNLSDLSDGSKPFKKGTTGEWNKTINKHPLEPNKKYVSENLNESYLTDGSGRVSEINVGSIKSNTVPANGYQRRKAVTAKGGDKVNDQGGHLLAARFGGAGEQINLVPMKKSINQAGGTWYQMEQEWANALSQPGGKVENIKIKILDYDAKGRPGRFEVTCNINGNIERFPHSNN